jgi:hypothetical protein
VASHFATMIEAVRQREIRVGAFASQGVLRFASA